MRTIDTPNYANNAVIETQLKAIETTLSQTKSWQDTMLKDHNFKKLVKLHGEAVFNADKSVFEYADGNTGFTLDSPSVAQNFFSIKLKDIFHPKAITIPLAVTWEDGYQKTTAADLQIGTKAYIQYKKDFVAATESLPAFKQLEKLGKKYNVYAGLGELYREGDRPVKNVYVDMNEKLPRPWWKPSLI